jgi:hypothetical protein
VLCRSPATAWGHGRGRQRRQAVVSRGGRQVLDLNRHAAAMLGCRHRLAIVEGAGHLFEEPGAMDAVATAAAAWFSEHLTTATPPPGGCRELNMAAPALPLGERAIVDAIRREAHALTGDGRDYHAGRERATSACSRSRPTVPATANRSCTASRNWRARPR